MAAAQALDDWAVPDAVPPRAKLDDWMVPSETPQAPRARATATDDWIMPAEAKPSRVTQNPSFATPDEPSKTLALSLGEYGITDEAPGGPTPQPVRDVVAAAGRGAAQGFGEQPVGFSDENREKYPKTYLLWQPVVAPADVAYRAPGALIGALSSAAAETYRQFGGSDAWANRLDRDLRILGQGALIESGMGGHHNVGRPEVVEKPLSVAQFLERVDAVDSPVVADFQRRTLVQFGMDQAAVDAMAPADRQAAFRDAIAKGGFGARERALGGETLALPPPGDGAPAQPAAARQPTPAAAVDRAPVERDGLIRYGYTEAQIDGMSSAQRTAEYENAVAAGAIAQPGTPVAAPAAPPVSVSAPVAAAPAVSAITPAPVAPIPAVNPAESLNDRAGGGSVRGEVGGREQAPGLLPDGGAGGEAAAPGGVLQAPAGAAEPVVQPAAEPPLAAANVSGPRLHDLFNDPRSAAEIRAAMQAAKAWTPSADWQPVPQVPGPAIDLTGLDVRDGPEGVRMARIPPEPGSRAAPVQLDQSSDVMLGAERTAAPSPAQADAGNYRKRHVQWNGLDITVETEAGQARTGIGGDGAPWSVTLEHPYGYLKNTKGRDGDHLDLYIGPHPDAPNVYVFDQVDPDTRRFDEHKLVIGARDLDQATAIYRAGFSDGSGEQRWGAVTELSGPELKAWIDAGDTKKPLAYAPRKLAAAPKEGAPLSLIQFLASKGGIREEAGELRHLGLERKFVPGYGRLVRESGMPLDTARELAAEAGYPVGAHSFGSADARMAGSTVRDLLDLLFEESRGNRVYTDTDQAVLVRRAQAGRVKIDKARAKEAEAEVREIAQRLKVARLTDDEVRSVVDQVMVHNAHPEDTLADVIERAAMAGEDHLVGLDTREGINEYAASEAVSAAAHPARTEAAQARQHAAEPDAGPAAGSPTTREQLGGIEHAAPETAGVAPPSAVHIASNPQAIHPRERPSAEAAAVKPAPSPEELEIPDFLRRVKDEPKPAVLEPTKPAPNIPENIPEAASATGRTPESAIKAEADKRWRNWTPSRESGLVRPRLASFVKQVRKERRVAEREEAKARAAEEKQQAREAAKQGRASKPVEKKQ